MGRDAFAREILADYEFNLDVAFLTLVEAEVADVNRAVEAASFVISEKPGDTSAPAPPPN